MAKETQGFSTRRELVADGGRPDSHWAAGDDPPAPPTDTGLLESLVDAWDPDSYLYRVRLAVAGEEAADNVLEELRRELDVRASTVDREVGPTDPAVFDVLATSDYDPVTVADALVEPPVVDAVAICPATAAVDAGSERDGDLDGATPEVGAGDAGGAAAAGGESSDVESAVQEARETFQELQAENERAEYEEVVADLEDVDFGKEFEAEEVDIDHLLEGADEFGEVAAGTANGGGEAPPGEFDLTSPDEGAAGSGGVTPAMGGAGPGKSAAGDGGRRDAATPELSPERVVDALATALEEGSVDDRSREAIKEGLDLGPSKTLKVRVDHLQTEVEKTKAYRESLEPFIDRYGGGEELVEEVDQRFETVEEQFEAVDARFETFQRNLGTVSAGVRELKSQLDDLEERFEAIAAVDEQLAAVDDRLEDVEQQASDRGDRLSELEGDLADLDEELAALAAETAESVSEVDDRVDDLADHLAELARWPDHLGEALAEFEPVDPSAGPAGGDDQEGGGSNEPGDDADDGANGDDGSDRADGSTDGANDERTPAEDDERTSGANHGEAPDDEEAPGGANDEKPPGGDEAPGEGDEEAPDETGDEEVPGDAETPGEDDEEAPGGDGDAEAPAESDTIADGGRGSN